MQLLIFDFILVCFYRCHFSMVFVYFVYISLPTTFQDFLSVILRGEWNELHQIWERLRAIIDGLHFCFLFKKNLPHYHNTTLTSRLEIDHHIQKYIYFCSSKLWQHKGNASQKSRQNYALFDPLQNWSRSHSASSEICCLEVKKEQNVKPFWAA